MTWLRDVIDRFRRRPVANVHTPEIREAQDALEYMRLRRQQIVDARVRAEGQRADNRARGR